MNKSEFLRAIAEDSCMSIKDVSKMFESLQTVVVNGLQNGEKITVTGFGTFEPKRRAARVGRNPHTREAVPIPARIIPSFKPGKRLMENVCRDIKNEKGGDL